MSGPPRGKVKTTYETAVAYADTSGPFATTYVAVETLSGDERTVERKTSRLKVVSERKVLTGPGLPSIELDQFSSVVVHAWTTTGWAEVMAFTEQAPPAGRGSHAGPGGIAVGEVPTVEEAAVAAHTFLNLFGEPIDGYVAAED